MDKKNYGNFQDRHHLCPTSRGGTNHPDNLLVMKRNIHEAIHKVFSNDLPVEQYARLVELNSTTHTKEFMQAICEVLSRQPEDIYREHVIDRR